MARKQLGIVLLLIATSGCAGRPWLTRAEPRSAGPAAAVPPVHDNASAATTSVPGFLPSRNARPGSPSSGLTATSQQLTSQQAGNQQARIQQTSDGQLANQLLPGGESPRQQIPLQTPDGQLLAATPVAALPNSYSIPYSPVYDHPAAGLPPQIQQYLDQKVEVAVRRQSLLAAPPAIAQNDPTAAAPDAADVERDAAFNINDTDATTEVAAAAAQDMPPADVNQALEAAPAGEPANVQLATATTNTTATTTATTKTANTAAPAGNVVPALHTTKSMAKPTPGQWRDAATTALDTLEKELATGTFNTGQRSRLNANARLLHAILNDSDQAVRPIDEFDEDEREYWKHLTYGLITSLDADEKHTSSRRSALALRSIRQAADHLANISTLDVRNLAFCSKVESYGRFDEFKTYGFKPGQEVLLYVEVENFAVESTGDRHETELQGEYSIFAADGQRVANAVLPLDKQVSKNRRHDYFIAYRVFVPKKIEQGHYTLQLTIEDVKGSKSNQASVEFWIR